jgi:hypothetical protein
MTKDSPKEVSLKIVSHRDDSGLVCDGDGSTEVDQGKGVTQRGDEQLALIRDVVEERVGSVVEPLYVYAPFLPVDIHNATEPGCCCRDTARQDKDKKPYQK